MYIPTELLFKILDLAFETNTIDYYGNLEIDRIPLKVFEAYFQELQGLAQLRFVCRHWSEVIPTLIYGEFVLASAPPAMVRRTVAMLKDPCHISLIRTLVVCEFSGMWTKKDPQDIRETNQLLNTHLKHTFASGANIRHVLLRGHTPLFRSRKWVTQYFTKVPPPLTRLTLNSCDSTQISQALMSSRETVEQLDLIFCSGWVDKPAPIFHLPKEIPQLKTLNITDSILKNELPKLFGRIGALTRTKLGARKSNLHTLYIRGISWLTPSTVLDCLQMNEVGKGLTVLHLQFHNPSTGTAKYATEIAKVCQALVDFRFVGPIEQTLFPALSPSLKTLGLSIQLIDNIPSSHRVSSWRIDWGYFTPKCLLDVVSPHASYNLQELIIFVPCRFIRSSPLSTGPVPSPVEYDPAHISILSSNGISVFTTRLGVESNTLDKTTTIRIS